MVRPFAMQVLFMGTWWFILKTVLFLAMFVINHSVVNTIWLFINGFTMKTIFYSLPNPYSRCYWWISCQAIFKIDKPATNVRTFKKKISCDCCFLLANTFFFIFISLSIWSTIGFMQYTVMACYIWKQSIPVTIWV